MSAWDHKSLPPGLYKEVHAATLELGITALHTELNSRILVTSSSTESNNSLLPTEMFPFPHRFGIVDILFVLHC